MNRARKEKVTDIKEHFRERSGDVARLGVEWKVLKKSGKKLRGNKLRRGYKSYYSESIINLGVGDVKLPLLCSTQCSADK